MPSPEIKIEYSRYFLTQRKKYVKNDRKRFADFKKTINLFLSNLIHPSLHIEKLQNAKGIHTIRLNKSDRIFFIWKEENTALLIDIGPHDKYRRY